MSDMTNEAVKALLDDLQDAHGSENVLMRAHKLKALARALLDARAELAQARADAAAAVALVVERAAERLEANRAHLNFAALLGLLRDEALPEPVVTALSNWLDGIAAAIRALAAEVVRLKDQVAGLVEALADAVGALNGAGEALSELASVLSRDPWEANLAYESACQAQSALAQAQPVAEEGKAND